MHHHETLILHGPDGDTFEVYYIWSSSTEKTYVMSIEDGHGTDITPEVPRSTYEWIEEQVKGQH